MKLHRKWVLRWYAIKDMVAAASTFLIILAVAGLVAVFFLWNGPE